MHFSRIIYNILCWENDDFGTTMFSVMLFIQLFYSLSFSILALYYNNCYFFVTELNF